MSPLDAMRADARACNARLAARCGVSTQGQRFGTAARRLQVRNMAAQGLSVAQIADELNVALNTIYTDLRRLGLDNPRRENAAAAIRARRRRVLACRARGWSLQAIADELGVSIMTVARDLEAT